MSLKPPLKFGCARLTLAHRTLQRHRLLSGNVYSLSKMGMQRIHPYRRRCKSTGSQVQSPDCKWQLHLDIGQIKDVKKGRNLSLPLLIYLYSPWKMLTTKFNLWKLKVFWDWGFKESEFVENARQALVLVTRLIVYQRGSYVKRYTTPMGYKQIKHDLFKPKGEQSYNWPHKLMRFEKYHIQRAIPLKVQRLDHYDHRFAFIDMIFLACRRTNDFTSKQDLKEMEKLVKHYAYDRNIYVQHPIVFAEIFVRFRRDYSLPSSFYADRWLISTFKVLHLDVLNHHPELYVGNHISDIFKSVESLPQNAAK